MSSEEPIMRPAWLDAPPVGEYPYEETHDLRHGPDLHPSLLGLLPYVGVWRGRGTGGYPTVDDFEFAQEVRFSHDGRPFLSYESRSWILDAQGNAVRPGAREVGWWRPASDSDLKSDDIEVLLTHHTGILELYVGRVNGLKVEMVTDAVVRSTNAKEVRAGQRLYGIVEGALLYAYEMAAVGEGMSPHLSAKLIRVGG